MAEDDASTSTRADADQAWYVWPRVLFCGGNEVELLRGGDALFPAMRRAIDGARREVWLSTYILHDDPTVLQLLDALVAAARRGVQVRIVVDGFGSKAALAGLQQRFGPLENASLTVFRPMRGWWIWMRPGQLRRLHHKLCAVDGRVGFVGGINLIDDRLDLRLGWSDVPRLDFAVAVSGPLVGPIEQTIDADWSRARFGRDWRDEIATVARSRRPVRQARRLIRRLRVGQARHFALPDDAQAGVPVQAAFVVRDNLRQRRTIEHGYIEAIRQARERVDVVCPYFYPGTAFRFALGAAAARGVRVRLLMQGRWDYTSAALAARALYAELLGRGVRIYEYMPAHLHAKVAVVDRDWATVGSSNIDPLSLLLNLEANIVVRDRAFASRLGAELDAAFEASREVTRAEVGGRLDRLRRAFVASVARVFLRVVGATGRY